MVQYKYFVSEKGLHINRFVNEDSIIYYVYNVEKIL